MQIDADRLMVCHSLSPPGRNRFQCLYCWKPNQFIMRKWILKALDKSKTFIHKKERTLRWQHHPSIFIFNLLNYNLLPPPFRYMRSLKRFSFHFRARTKEKTLSNSSAKGICIPFTGIFIRAHLLLWTASFQCIDTPIVSMCACKRTPSIKILVENEMRRYLRAVRRRSRYIESQLDN